MKITLILGLISFNMMLFGTTPHAYVTEFSGDAVSIIDVNRNTLQKIFGFENPHVVRVTFNGTAAYVGDEANNIYKIKCIEHTVTKICTLSSHPVAFCILPDASYLYAATTSGTLAIINLQTNTLEKEIPNLLKGPQDIRSTPDGQFVYVSNKGNGTVSVIRTEDQKLYQVISGLQYPVGLIFTIDGKYLYVTDSASNCIYVIHTSDNSIVDTILGFSTPKYIVMSPKKNTAYISNGGNDSISILRLSDNFIIGTIPVPNPSAMAITDDGAFLYVASEGSDVFKISTLDGSIESVISNFSTPTNLSFTNNNAPPDTVNGWQVVLNCKKPYNQITWSQPAGNPYQYRIFADDRQKHLIATVQSTSTSYVYNDINILVGQTYSYYVIADYSNGFSSTIGGIKISPGRIGLPFEP